MTEKIIIINRESRHNKQSDFFRIAIESSKHRILFFQRSATTLKKERNRSYRAINLPTAMMVTISAANEIIDFRRLRHGMASPSRCMCIRLM